MNSSWFMDSMLAHSEMVVPPTYAALRHQQREALKTMGLPTRHQERWKYANLHFLKDLAFKAPNPPSKETMQASLQTLREAVGKAARFIVMVNGSFNADLSDVLPAGVDVQPLSDVLSSQALPQTPINADVYPFAALNQADLSTGMGLYLREQTTLDSVVVVSLFDGHHATLVQPTVFIRLAANARLNVLEIPIVLGEAPVVINQMVTVILGENAECQWVKSQALPLMSTQLAHYQIEQAKNSRMYYTNLTQGARFSRDEVIVDLQAPGAVAKTSGYTQLSHHQQFADNHVEICHASPHTDSEMLYKGTLDAASVAVFNGRLWVKPEAQKITAYQANHTLLLSDTAEMYSKPELEIYADDVKCKHGATTGKIDEEALFYLQSRGIERQAARALLMAGFRNEVMDTIHCDAVRNFAIARMEQP